MSVLCRGKTSASSRWLRQCVSHTKSTFIQPAQSFDEAVDVPVVFARQTESSEFHSGFPSCVATSSTNNPDDTAKVKVSQGQPDRWIPAPSEVETVHDQPGNPKDCRDDTAADCTQNAVKIPQAQFIDRITVVPVGIQRQTPTIQSPQQPLEVTQTQYLIQWQMRSFDGSLSRQPVCEQTRGVLRHTERVQDGKVQKQDWKQSLEKKFCVPPASPRSGSRRRRQQGPRGSQRSTGRRVVNQKCVPVEVLYVVTGCSETSVLSLPEGVAAPNRQMLRQQHLRRRCGVFAAVCCGSGRTSNGPTRVSGVAAGLFVSSTGIFNNSMVCALWR